ncbi:hypothetical protein TNCV_4057051 [Trichonephila clavipes]|nr:hypothetical protein TNCV_4057051 [Trichonephila clavipes]
MGGVVGLSLAFCTQGCGFDPGPSRWVFVMQKIDSGHILEREKEREDIIKPGEIATEVNGFGSVVNVAQALLFSIRGEVYLYQHLILDTTRREEDTSEDNGFARRETQNSRSFCPICLRCTLKISAIDELR